ncbi:MAG TPA: LacI family DNA-binding transcriptional regulator, partial [Capsulimonadaceae bacterium]|nr:LacI family DNA-binding transcriptional regulator [Capsulimonadaceae bacterium]
MKRPTRDDVARAAGVSGWTVSRVLNGREDASIRGETRTRVLDAAKQLGYRPNNSARALVTGRCSTIGFWTCFDFSQHRAHVMHIMQQQMQSSGFEMVIRDVERQMEHDPDFSRTFQLPVDGIIAFDNPTAGIAFSQRDPSRSIPFVSMGGYWAKDRDFVGIDLYAGTVDAINHLLATGRRRIVYLLPSADKNWPVDARLEAYEHAMSSAGIESHLLRTADPALSTARRAVDEFLRTRPDIDAIFCHNDDMALG